ncbi:MAG: membrane protein insertion efficiency factor YidD [Dehalococcoidia bacterium]|nr:membrane protein insertion efficiency factor YidD [Dehalococcoidia bacterium]
MALGLVQFYQGAVSAFIPSSCRFSPTCSQYCYEAIGSHGMLKGTWLTLKRLSRCRPMGGRGYDPVP